MKKITVTVGIPAYNEEANITRLLSEILNQEETNFIISKVLIISDASIDATERKVKEIADKRVELLINSSRQGQIYSQNKIFSLSDSDVVVLLEADTFPNHKRYLHELLRPLAQDEGIDLVQGNWKMLPSITFIGKIFATQMSIYQSLTEDEKDPLVMLCSGRGGRGFTKNVYKHLVWPQCVPEDVYALLWCKKNTIRYKFQKSAVCFYRSPQKFTDYIRERQKIRSAELSLRQYFSRKDVTLMYDRPYSLRLKLLFLLFVKHPILAISYAFLKIHGRNKLASDQFTDFWLTTDTTKIL